MKIPVPFLVLALLGSGASAGTIEMTVNGLVCGFCAQGIEKTLRKNPATADVFVSLEHRLVAVATTEGQDISDEELRKSLTASGYDVKDIRRTATPIGELRARIAGENEMTDPHARNVGIAIGTLLASSTTLVCCVLPAVLVALGAGAVVVGLVSAVPQLVWLSEHKALVFGVAALFLAASGLLLWRARSLPCPTDPALARSCTRLRRISLGIYSVAAVLFALGATVAFWPFSP